MVALTFWFVWMTLSGGEFLRAFVIILAAAASGVFWAARPNMITFLLAGVFLWILEEFRKHDSAHSRPKMSLRANAHGRERGSLFQKLGDCFTPQAPFAMTKKLWVMPVLMMIWANSHGGFAVGFILWGAYFVDTLLRWRLGTYKRANVQTLTIVGLLMVLAVCINPSGPVILLYPFKTIGIGVLQDFIQEWQSPNFHELQLLPFLVLLILTFGALGVSKKRVSLVDFLLLSGFIVLSLTAGRNIALFALVSPMVLTRHGLPFLDEAGERLGLRRSTQAPVGTTRWHSRLNWIILGLLVLSVGIKTSLVIPQKVNQEHFQESLPVAAVEYLRTERPAGQLFNSYNWGGYLLWALPEYPVFVDGRTDLYGDELIGEWIQVVQAEEGWENVLDDWDVNLIMVEHSRPVVSELADVGWNLLYEDEIAVVYGRD